MYILDWINSWLVFSPLQIGILLVVVALLVFNLAVFVWHCQKEPRIECGATGGPGPGEETTAMDGHMI